MSHSEHVFYLFHISLTIDLILQNIAPRCLMRRSRNFCQRGAGPTDRKKLVFLFYFSSQLILQRGPMVNFKESYAFPRFQGWGVQHFPGVWGPNANAYRLDTIELVIVLGGLDPLWICACVLPKWDKVQEEERCHTFS